MSRLVETKSWSARDVDGGDLGQRGALLRGVVRTPHGMVLVVSLRQGLIEDRWYPEVTRLYFIWRGREYIRSYARLLTRAGVTRAAGRFAREIAKDPNIWFDGVLKGRGV